MNEPYLSLVIPAYNEEQRLRRHLPGLIEWFNARRQPFEIIIVDDGSRDATAEVVQEFPPVKLITYKPNRGKGGAVKAGMLAATGRYVLFADADQSTPIAEVEKLLAKLDGGGYDVAIASRRVAGSNVEQAQSGARSLSSLLFAFGVRVLCLRGIADTQCGFKCMKREVAQQVFPQVMLSSVIFDVEMLVLAARAGYRIVEVPVKWIHDHDTRLPYNLRRALSVWLDLFRIRARHGVWWPVRVKQ